VLALALLMSGGGIAQAYWSSARTQVGSSIAAVSLPAPATVGCTNQSILLVSVAKVSWSAVPGAGGYRVTVTRASGGTPLVIDQTATSIDLSTGVLGDLLSGLLSPTVLTVKVQPYQDAGAGGRWVSSSFVPAQANARLLPIGTTCA
jgi:hypothetical protein